MNSTVILHCIIDIVVYIIYDCMPDSKITKLFDLENLELYGIRGKVKVHCIIRPFTGSIQGKAHVKKACLVHNGDFGEDAQERQEAEVSCEVCQ